MPALPRRPSNGALFLRAFASSREPEARFALRRKGAKFELGVLIALASPSAGSAQVSEIVVTATGAEQAADKVGQAITVIDRASIERRQLQTVSDLLATTPGITVSRNGGIGQPTALRIRGAEGDQTLVVIDGVRVNDPSSTGGGFDFGNLLIGNIERIEVLRGPNSVPWGSQAIGGVVDIRTALPTERFGTSLDAEYGYRNTRRVVGNVRGGSGRVRGSLGGGWFDTDGISAFRFGTERDGYRQIAANGRVEIDVTPDATIDLRGTYADSRVDFDGFPRPAFAFADTSGYSTTKQAFGYAGVTAKLFGGALDNRLGFAIADTRRASFNSTNAAPSRFVGRTERYEYRGDARIGERLRAVFGAEHEDSRFSTDTTTDVTGITSGFVQLVADSVDRLTLTGGARVDDHRTYGTQATFSGNAALRLGAGTTLRVSYGEGFKAPTLFQLFSFFGDDRLEPETSRSYDIGIEQRTPSDALRIGVTLFRRDTRNQIDFTTTATRPNGVYVNVTRTRAEGAELFAELRPSRRLILNGSYTLIDARNRLTGGVLPRRPRHSVNADLDWIPREGLRLGASVRTVSDSRDNDFRTFAPTSLDGYALVGLRASLMLGQRFELFGRVENLTDAIYETVSGYGTEGRNAHVGVRVRL